MKIVYKTGDMLDGPEAHVVHGTNARGVMGSGVAAAIRARYPAAYEEYRRVFEKDGLTLGQTIWVKGSPHTVINAVTQADFGPDAKKGRIYVSYEAIEKAFHQINLFAKHSREIESAQRMFGRVEVVAMPLIGAGLAGGHWPTIAEIIERVTTEFQPVVYTLDGKVPV